MPCPLRSRSHESQEDILDAALAALTAADIPPDEHAWAVPDPDCGRPAELAGLTRAELEELRRPRRRRCRRRCRPGAGPGRDRPRRGRGFADGRRAGRPGARAAAGRVRRRRARPARRAVSDDELIGVMRAWRRQTSWAQARELAAIAELARRRPADRTPPAAPGAVPGAS